MRRGVIGCAIGLLVVMALSAVWVKRPDPQSQTVPFGNEGVTAPGAPLRTAPVEQNTVIGDLEAKPKYDWTQPMRSLQREFSRLRDGRARLGLLQDLVNSFPSNESERRRRAYAVRLLGVLANETPELAREAFALVLTVARTDDDAFARIMAVSAIVGSVIPEQSGNNQQMLVYFDPDTRVAVDRFGTSFPEWCRTAPETQRLLATLSDRALDPAVRCAAIRARAVIADEQSVRDLGHIIHDRTEEKELRCFAVRVLYRSGTGIALEHVSKIARGEVEELPEGYQFEALSFLARSNRLEAKDETVLASMCSDPSTPFQKRKLALRTAAEAYRSTKSRMLAGAISSGLEDLQIDVRIESARILGLLEDRGFVPTLASAATGEKSRLVLDYLNATLNRLEPDSPRRPSIQSRLEELKGRLQDSGLSAQEREACLAESQQLSQQWKELCAREGH